MKKKLMIVSGKARGGTWSPNVSLAKKKKKKFLMQWSGSLNSLYRTLFFSKWFELDLEHAW